MGWKGSMVSKNSQPGSQRFLKTHRWSDKAMGSASSQCLHTGMGWQVYRECIKFKSNKEIQNEEQLFQKKWTRGKPWSCSYFYWRVYDSAKGKGRNERKETAEISIGKQAEPWTTGQFVLRTRTKAKSVKDYVVGNPDDKHTQDEGKRACPSPNFVVPKLKTEWRNP